MVNKTYIIEEGESGLYNLYRKVGDNYKYQMAFIHKDIAMQACHLLNLEAISFDGMKQNWKKANDELKKLEREFFEYRMEHPEDTKGDDK